MKFRQVAMVVITSAAIVGAGAWVAAQGGKAKAELKNAKGEVVGQAELADTPNGVLIRVKLMNLPPGVHAFHVHTTGRCDPPDFTSAGGHLNPAKAMHGFHNEKGAHHGDLPNIHIPKDGMIEFEALADGVNIAGSNALLDSDGAALMVHAGADDYRSDPAGDAGARIACGVIQR